MTSVRLPRPFDASATISVTSAQLAMAASISYQILLIVLIFLRPDLDPSWHTISEWAIGPHGWIMSVAFLVSGLSYAALFVMLRPQVHGIVGHVGLGLLLICVIGATGVGVFTTDPMPLRSPLSTTGTLHVILGSGQLILLPFAALLINLSLARRNQQWAAARRLLRWTAGLPLFGFAAFAVYTAAFVSPLGAQAYGPGVNIGWPPRVAFFTYMLWLVTLGWQAITCSRDIGTEGEYGGSGSRKLRAQAFPTNPLLAALPSNLGHRRISAGSTVDASSHPPHPTITVQSHDHPAPVSLALTTRHQPSHNRRPSCW